MPRKPSNSTEYQSKRGRTVKKTSVYTPPTNVTIKKTKVVVRANNRTAKKQGDKSYRKLVAEAISALADRKGSSAKSILQYVQTNNQVPLEPSKRFVKMALRNGSEDGTFKKEGARYKLVKKIKKSRKSSKKTTTTKKSTKKSKSTKKDDSDKKKKKKTTKKSTKKTSEKSKKKRKSPATKKTATKSKREKKSTTTTKSTSPKKTASTKRRKTSDDNTAASTTTATTTTAPPEPAPAPVTVAIEAPAKKAAAAPRPKPALNRQTTTQKKDEMMAKFIETTKHKQGQTKIELCFSFDTTVSMFSCLEEVRSKLGETIKRLMQDIPGIRIAVIAHGDYDTKPYIIETMDFSSDMNRILDFVKGVKSVTGHTIPEAYELVLRDVQKLSWSDDHSKCLVMIGDSVPNEGKDSKQNIDWRQEVDSLKARSIKIYGVQALPTCLAGMKVAICPEEKATKFWTELAERADGTLLQLRQFNVITELFLGVCYRQAIAYQLGNYEKEVRAATNTLQRSGSKQLLVSDQMDRSGIALSDEELLQIHKAIHSLDETVTVKGKEYPIARGAGACRFVRIEQGEAEPVTLIEQDKDKNSPYAKMAIEGRQVTWIVKSGKWGLIIDDAIREK